VSKPTAKAAAASKSSSAHAAPAATTPATAKVAKAEPATKPAAKPQTAAAAATKASVAKDGTAKATSAKAAPAKAAGAAAAAASPAAQKPAPKSGSKAAKANQNPPPPSAASTAVSAVSARHGFAERFGPAARPAGRPEPDPFDTTKAAPKDPKLANAWKTKSGRELSEAELLAMPDSVYMNEQQLEFFRARLEQQKLDLLSSAGETTEHLREDTSIVPDPVDRATIEEEHALELRTRDRERKLLKKIAQALARLDNGDYGYCDETGEPIGLQRLMARPTATLSLEAQQRREMKQKMFGD